MEYNRIPVVLKRYSFASKMQACTIESMKTMDFMSTVSPEILRTLILPWDIETFVIFAVKAQEYNNLDIRDKNGKYFYEIMQSIYKYKDPNKLQKNDDFTTRIIMHSALTQFDLQENQEYKYYRYNYFFSLKNEEVDMSYVFEQKFGVSYERIWLFGIVINVLFGSTKAPPDVFHCFVDKFSDVLPLFCISREEYIQKIDVLTSDILDYPFCVRPSYSYPFIDYDGVTYLPLPHLVYRATTSSLLFRLTEGNNSLRSDIGRIVLEQYLFDILTASKAYDEVLPEQKYIQNHTDSNTPDILVRSGSHYLFFESKSAVPSNGVRVFEQDAIDKHINKLANAVGQLYKQIQNFNNGVYYPFSNQRPTDFSLDNIWGIVSVMEDSFANRKQIYDKVAEHMGIDIDSKEYTWIIKHIKVINLYEIEKHAFIGNNIINELIISIDKDGPFDYSLSECPSGEIVNSDLMKFKERMGDTIKAFGECIRNDNTAIS